jgi:hypothetical protein
MFADSQHTLVMSPWFTYVTSYVLPVSLSTLLFCGVLRRFWRNVLERRLNIKLNKIWREEHEEGELDRLIAATTTGTHSLRRSGDATVATEPLTEHQNLGTYEVPGLLGPNSLPHPTAYQLLLYPPRSASHSALNIGESERSDQAL